MGSVKFKYTLQSMANLQMYHMAKHRIKTDLKEAICKEVKPLVMVTPLPVKVTMCRIAPRSLDYDNLVYAFKPARDQISKLYFMTKPIGQADSFDCFEWVYAQERGAVKEYAIRIDIEGK
jgi:hypothetical protein